MGKPTWVGARGRPPPGPVLGGDTPGSPRLQPQSQPPAQVLDPQGGWAEGPWAPCHFRSQNSPPVCGEETEAQRRPLFRSHTGKWGGGSTPDPAPHSHGLKVTCVAWGWARDTGCTGWFRRHVPMEAGKEKGRLRPRLLWYPGPRGEGPHAAPWSHRGLTQWPRRQPALPTHHEPLCGHPGVRQPLRTSGRTVQVNRRRLERLPMSVV